MPISHRDKGLRFRALHEGRGAFIVANAWDIGSARILAGVGFDALATSSGAFAGTLGRLDGNVTRDEAMSHARSIVDATDLPVSADLENGFGDAPEFVAETIRLAAQAGLVGGSIEDATGRRDQPIYEFGLAVERIAAAAHAVRELAVPFLLTGRCENFLRGKTDLADTIARLQAFERAGADALFAPGLPDLAAVREVCAAVSKPVNFMVGMPDQAFTLAELEAAGVKRVSLATTLYRAAMAGLVAAGREAKERGTFGYLKSGMSSADLRGFMKRQ